MDTPAPPPPPPITVAIVDDSAALRAMLRALLEQDGRFSIVGEAANGVEGLKLIAASKPDAILLDLAMPGLDGLDCIPKIKEVAPEAEIVVVSAAGRSLAAQALEAGAHGYFSKLDPLEHVVFALGSLFSGRRPRGS